MEKEWLIKKWTSRFFWVRFLLFLFLLSKHLKMLQFLIKVEELFLNVKISGKIESYINIFYSFGLTSFQILIGQLYWIGVLLGMTPNLGRVSTLIENLEIDLARKLLENLFYMGGKDLFCADNVFGFFSFLKGC